MREDQIRRLLGHLEDDRDPEAGFTDALFGRLGSVVRSSRRSRMPMLLIAAALTTLLAAGLAIGFGRLPLPIVVDATMSPMPSAFASLGPAASVAPSTSNEPSTAPSTSASAEPELRSIAGRTLVAEADGLRLRSAPSEDGDVSVTIPRGVRMGATGAVEGGWVEVRIGPGPLAGWVSSGPDRSWLRVVADGAIAFWRSTGGTEDSEAGWVLVSPLGDAALNRLADDDVIEVAWSPDGSSVAMTVAGDDGTAVGVADADGSNRRTIGSGGYGPSWSPDGRLAWSSMAGIVVANESLTPTMLETELRNPGRPFWSPDSTRLAVVAMDCPECPEDEPIMGDVPGAVYVVDVASGTTTKLTDPGYYGFGGWSPDGDRITFTRIDLSGEQPQQAFSVAVEGGSPTPILDGAAVHEAPTWSPDGSRLALGTPEGLVVMSGDGGTPSVLVPSDASLSVAQWSPSGQWLVYQTSDGPDTALWIVRADGSEAPRRITATDVAAGMPAWRPLSEPLP